MNGELTSSGMPLPRMPPLRGRARRARPAERIPSRRRGRLHREAGPHVHAWRDADRWLHVLKLFASYSFGTPAATSTITVRLDNATNELYRNHLNYLKDLVPEVGRNFKLLYSVKF